MATEREPRVADMTVAATAVSDAGGLETEGGDTAGGETAGGGHSSHPVPVGLLTLAVVAIVLAVVVVLVVLQLTGASTQAHGPTVVQQAPAALVQEVTAVPVSAFDSVGDPSAPLLSAPTVLTGQPALTIGGLPTVVWVGGLYCPTCAAERWALVIALGRFGTFDKLFTTASAGSEVFADTPTFSFDGAVYRSPTVALSAVEEYGNQASAYAPAGFQKLQTPDALQQSVLRSYDVAPYAHPGLLPFIDVANKMVVSGSSFSPGVLGGLSMQQIATGLADPTSQAADALLGAANQITAAICGATAERPTVVCGSPAVVSTSESLGLGS